jgi:hypothetical protein
MKRKNWSFFVTKHHLESPCRFTDKKTGHHLSSRVVGGNTKVVAGRSQDKFNLNHLLLA